MAAIFPELETEPASRQEALSRLIHSGALPADAAALVDLGLAELTGILEAVGSLDLEAIPALTAKIDTLIESLDSLRDSVGIYTATAEAVSEAIDRLTARGDEIDKE